MSEWTNSDGQWGSSEFTVDPTPGKARFTTIQEALNAANSAGGGTVYVHPSTIAYVEDLTFFNNVSLIGATGANLGAKVQIRGEHTFNAAGSCAIENVFLVLSNGNSIFNTIGNATGNTMNVNNIRFAATAGSKLFTSNCSLGNSAQFVMRNSAGQSGGSTFVVGGSGNVSFSISQVTSLSGLGNTFDISAPASVLLNDCVMIGAYVFSLNDLSASVQANFCDFTGSAAEAINFVQNAQATIQNSIVNSNAVSGYWATGIGNLTYGAVTLNGTALLIDPLVTATALNQVPYAEAGSLSSIRGSAAFNAAQFSSNDGFVSLLSPTGIVWSNQSAPITVSSFTGSWIDGAVTMTLPPTPNDGDICQFISVTGNGMVQANTGQDIALGSTASTTGGFVTATQAGDSITLIYRNTGQRWWAWAFIGNWTF